MTKPVTKKEVADMARKARYLTNITGPQLAAFIERLATSEQYARRKLADAERQVKVLSGLRDPPGQAL